MSWNIDCMKDEITLKDTTQANACGIDLTVTLMDVALLLVMNQFGSTYHSLIFQIGLLTFADNAKLEFHLNEFLTKQDILDNMKANFTDGKTNTAAAIELVHC